VCAVRKLFRTAVLIFLAFNRALAQDATKVEPKHYKLAFENDKVQVVYITYGPHEKSKMHSHPQGVVVDLTESHLRFTDQDGKTQDVYSKAGEARWFPPFRHTVENLGDATFSGIYIGIKGGPSAGGGANQPAPQLQLDDETAKILMAYLLKARPAPEATPAPAE
jgi:quercetin dioxygenase-like cupin family protein